ncbi:MAG: hypothetical protein RR408_03875 [Carnobacterium sp.]|uniref:hypothetical protein n=1 Tax=Carnobacterium sp. TaxID=48221 RepID=UPI002FCC9F70
MKRYWKLMAISLIAILAIAVFYLQPVFTKDQYPAFTFKTVKGDPSELNDLTLNAGYTPVLIKTNESTFSYTQEPLTLTNRETHYENQQSYFEKLSANSSDPQLQSLQKEYKQFMRGKYLDSHNFFEDDIFLAYVAIDESSLHTSAKKAVFDIQILNKNSKETTSYAIDIPVTGAENYLSIQKVQIIDSALKIVTENNFLTDKLEEFHIYHLDLGNQKVTKEDVLSFESELSSGNQNNMVRMLTDNSQAAHVENELVFEAHYNAPFDEEKAAADPDYYPEYLGSEFCIYNLKTNTTHKLAVPAELNPENTMPLIDGTTLYLYDLTDDAITVYAVSVNDVAKNTVYTLELPAGSSSNREWLDIVDAKLYLATPTKGSQTEKELTVYDLDSNTILYEGIIEKAKGSTQKSTDGLNIYDGIIN